MKVALFKNTRLGFQTLGDEAMARIDDYMRLTEYSDVQFIPIDNAEILAKEAALLVELKNKTLSDAKLKVRDFDEKINNLLALSSSATFDD